jgi:hypothetical protein
VVSTCFHMLPLCQSLSKLDARFGYDLVMLVISIVIISSYTYAMLLYMLYLMLGYNG